MTPLVSAENIVNYIPQRPPFVMVDELLLQDETGVNSRFYVREENIFSVDGRLSVSGLLENIAQTAAANVGYHCAVNNKPVPLGFIGAISKVKVFNLPKVNSTFETRIDIVQEIFNITLIEGVVSQKGETLISCQMKIMIADTDTP